MNPDLGARALEVIERVIGDVEKHVAMLQDAAERPEVDRDRLAASALELLLRSMAVHVEALLSHERVPASTRASLGEALAAIRALEADSVRAEHHLSDLASGWRCSHCSSKVPREARVHARGGAFEVSLACQRCGRASVLAPEGRAMFDRVFGPLATPGWDPSRHGFVTEGAR